MYREAALENEQEVSCKSFAQVPLRYHPLVTKQTDVVVHHIGRRVGNEAVLRIELHGIGNCASVRHGLDALIVLAFRLVNDMKGNPLPLPHTSLETSIGTYPSIRGVEVEAGDEDWYIKDEPDILGVFRVDSADPPLFCPRVVQGVSVLNVG